MRIDSRIVTLDVAAASLPEAISSVLATYTPVIRWGLVGMAESRFHLEIASLFGTPATASPFASPSTVPSRLIQSSYVVFVVPTGVGASIGGFIGDGGAIVRAMTEVAENLIVHPNVANAGTFYAASERALYVDGLTLDRFLSGEGQLDSRPAQRIGILVDRISDADEIRLKNTLNALRAVEGASIAGYSKCSSKIQASVSKSAFGHFVGTVNEVDELLERADGLRRAGAEAIAVVTDIDGFTSNDVLQHYRGEGVNPVGAIEALISRAVTWHTGLPCAHAPLYTHGLGTADTLVDPRAAAEVVSMSGVPCLIHGLTRSRRLTATGGIPSSAIRAVVISVSCAGGVPAFSVSRFDTPVIAVRQNHCLVGVDAKQLNLPHVHVVDTYADALAFLCCMKAGVSWDAFNGRHPALASTSV